MAILVTKSNSAASAPEADTAEKIALPGISLCGKLRLLGRRMPALRTVSRYCASAVTSISSMRPSKPPMCSASNSTPCWMDARSRPVNYCLVRIVPPLRDRDRSPEAPFIVFDPRAGHGPGIGGMKHDSEIGVALAGRSPLLFRWLSARSRARARPSRMFAEPEPRFVENVAALHPDAEGKPCLIGNCQAGWQIMMMSAFSPDLVGPIVLAGAPLSYWAGVHGKNPLRYLGGLFGGTWLTSFAGDLGHGIFDGAYLIQQFRKHESVQHIVEKELPSLCQRGHRNTAFSRVREMVGQPRPAQCRGNAVHRR